MKEFDTIFAVASAPGRAGVAVLRISGADAQQALGLTLPTQFPPPREAVLRPVLDPGTGEIIDRALVMWFPAPRSFTGEDVVEFHLHGSRAILNAVSRALGSLPNFRIAEHGEFTRRAFGNDKLDLTEAEAIADLVNAETDAQRRQAMRQLGGELGRLYEGWRSLLTRSLAYMEATIDFPDEDLPPGVEQQQLADMKALADEIARHLDDGRRGERLREGFSIAILGPPNAGKSSILNALARREAAIVSETAGTTRDVIEAHLDLGGYPVILADTAGLRESADTIENEGIRRALDRAANADLKLVVFDGESWPATDETTKKLIDKNTIVIVNKSDLVDPSKHAPVADLFVSAKTGRGIQELIERIVSTIDLGFSIQAAPVLTRERHRAALEDCHSHLLRAMSAMAWELRAEDTRLAARALGRITGRVDVEDLLDVIFRDFCIGK